MLSLGLSVFIVLYLTVVGRGLLAAIGYKRGVLRAWLLSPGIGLAALLFGVGALNQAGLPIRSFAWIWTLALLLGFGGVLWLKRPKLPGKSLLALGGIGLGFLVWAGWPAFQFGFNWVSYANDDMVNYCLAAERFASNGFFDIPTALDFNQRDLTQAFWIMHVADLMRFGSEHLLSWALSITGLKATQIFMSVILALGVIQISATAALVLHKGRHRKWALTSAALLAISPLFILSSLYQLIAQVGGIALMLTVLSLLTETPRKEVFGNRIRRIFPAGLVAATLCIYYPEVSPFAWLSLGLYIGLLLLGSFRRGMGQLQYAVHAGILTCVLLNYNLYSYIYTLLKQFASTTVAKDINLSMFPFFLLPTGFANLFGWMPYTADFPEPIPSLTVPLGMLLALMVVWAGMVGTWRRSPVALLALVMFTMAVKLFLGANDFGLYKLAMFMQPALMCMVAWWLCRLPQARWSVPVVLGTYLATSAPTALSYTQAAQGLGTGSINEFQFSSLLGTSIPRPEAKNTPLLGTVENVVAAKFAASELRGIQTTFPSRDFFFVIRTAHATGLKELHPLKDVLRKGMDLEADHFEKYMRRSSLWNTDFLAPVNIEAPRAILSVAPQLTAFNKFDRELPRIPERLYEIRPTTEAKNFLYFIHSGLGNHYFLGERDRIGIFQTEYDSFLPGHVFTGLGRFMLLRIENPTPEIYVRVALTKTLLYPRRLWAESAMVRGETDLPIEAIGGGSMNRIVGPLKPVFKDGGWYIALDLRETPTQMKDNRKGIKALYNKQVPMDFRRLACWGRDISALSPEQFAKIKRPSEVSRFPEDLAMANGLEFAGAYEDGWVSQKSEWLLAASPEGGFVRVEGMILKQEATGVDDGVVSFRLPEGGLNEANASAGDFDYLIPAEQASKFTRFKMEFSSPRKLPYGDERIVGCKLRRISLVAQAPARIDFNDTNSPRFPAVGIDHDGWSARSVRMRMPTGHLKLTMEVPGWAGTPPSELRILIDGKGVETRTLGPGIHTLVITGDGRALQGRELRLEFNADFAMPAPDARVRAARMISMETSAAELK